MSRGERARYDPEKVRRRAEETLGWESGSSAGMTFETLREQLKAKPEKWKALKDVEDMLRTGDQLLGALAPPRGRRQFDFAEAPVADSLLDRAFRRLARG